MKNVYVVRLSKPVKMDVMAPHTGRETSHLYVVASSFPNATEAVLKKHPCAVIRGIDHMNYEGMPVVVGD